MRTDGNVTCHLFTCVMVKSTNGDVMGTKSDTRLMHNLPTVATTARIHPSTIETPPENARDCCQARTDVRWAMRIQAVIATVVSDLLDRLREA